MQYPHRSSSKGTLQTVKAGGTTDLFWFDASHVNTADVWLQLFNASSAAAVTLGTTVADLSMPIPAGDGTLTGGRREPFVPPMRFSNGLVYAFTTTRNGSTAPTSNVEMNVGFG